MQFDPVAPAEVEDGYRLLDPGKNAANGCEREIQIRAGTIDAPPECLALVGSVILRREQSRISHIVTDHDVAAIGDDRQYMSENPLGDRVAMRVPKNQDLFGLADDRCEVE